MLYVYVLDIKAINISAYYSFWFDNCLKKRFHSHIAAITKEQNGALLVFLLEICKLIMNVDQNYVWLVHPTSMQP